MLIHPPATEGNGPPAEVEAFRREVAVGLADDWDVKVVAYDDDVPGDTRFVSAMIVATSGRVRVEIARHGGGNVVFVRLGESDLIPFEDLAVDKGEIDLDDLLARASCTNAEDAGAFEPLVPFARILDLLRSWGPELNSSGSPASPGHPDLLTRLRSIGDTVAARVFPDEH